VAGLKDDDPRTRQYAAWALGVVGLGEKAAIPPLKELLLDKTAAVRQAAAEALAKIEHPVEKPRDGAVTPQAKGRKPEVPAKKPARLVCTQLRCPFVCRLSESPLAWSGVGEADAGVSDGGGHRAPRYGEGFATSPVYELSSGKNRVIVIFCCV
jgi:hypothetical protein